MQVSYPGSRKRVGRGSMQGSIISMLIEIKNAALVKRNSLELPYSRFRENLSNLLVRENYLKSSHRFKKGEFSFLRLDFPEDPRSDLSWLSFRQIKIISKPGRRIYLSTSQIAKMLSLGRRNIILSTSRGLMKAPEAAKRKIGGEAICELG